VLKFHLLNSENEERDHQIPNKPDADLIRDLLKDDERDGNEENPQYQPDEADTDQYLKLRNDEAGTNQMQSYT